MTTKRGDVVLVQFPRSDLRAWVRRPALVGTRPVDARVSASPLLG